MSNEGEVLIVLAFLVVPFVRVLQKLPDEIRHDKNVL